VASAVIAARLVSAIGALALIATLATEASAQAAPSYTPTNGFVPDSATATRVAEAVLTPVYGAKQIESERPFSATLRDGVWYVDGYLPRGSLGGTAHVEIAKADGRIIRMVHYQ
jgi:NTF2 fold immunity protein